MTVDLRLEVISIFVVDFMYGASKEEVLNKMITDRIYQNNEEIAEIS